ncbi:MAG: hypothetical protein RBR15_04535 [Sphaerochaeta sp.]|nr:hypothetical protein [Sphaerochaeta sp.]
MKLIEKILVGKRKDPALCEDGIFFNGDFAAVVDGCSSHKGALYEGKSSGVIAKDTILGALTMLPPQSTMEEAFLACNRALEGWYEEHHLLGVMGEDPSMRCCAYAAIVSRARREVWILGDCQALVDGQLYTSEKPIDTLMENLRALYIEVELQKGRTEAQVAQSMEPIQAKLAQQMALQSLFQNTLVRTSFSYHVLDGFFTNVGAVQVVKLEGPAKDVALGTDGYPHLHASLHASEESLASLLEGDPLCFRENRATKGVMEGNISFDDRAYLRIIV